MPMFTYHSVRPNIFDVIAFLALLSGVLVGVPTFPSIVATLAMKESILSMVIRHPDC